ncbi:hypothetical protein [Deinococcus sp. UYEF24]
MTTTHASTNVSPTWINGLNPAQLALARVIQQNGLEAKRVDLSGFFWYRDGELLVTISQQATLSEAFDLAVQSLPCVYIQPADGPVTGHEERS